MDHHNAKTTSWTRDELSRIETAEQLEIAPRRRDGTLRKSSRSRTPTTP
jgi:hypothetical protein